MVYASNVVSPGHREWDAANMLRADGFDVASPVAFGESIRFGGCPRQSFVIVREVKGQQLDDFLEKGYPGSNFEEQQKILSYLKFENRHLPFLKDIAKHPKVTKVRLTGTIAAFELKTDETNGYLNVAGKTIKAYALQHNVFIRPLGNVIYLLPPLCIEDTQLDELVEKLDTAITATLGQYT